MAKKVTPPVIQKKEKARAESTPTKSEIRNPIWWILGLGALVVLLTYFIFSPAFKYDFVNWDDPDNLTENPLLAKINEPKDLDFAHLEPIFDFETGRVMGNYNPLPIVSFAWEKAHFGIKKRDGKTPNAEPYHYHNVVLHCVMVAFAFWLLIEMGFSPFAAAFGGLLMGIHPMRVESVAWITERKDVLFGAFFFMALVAWAKFAKRQNEGQNRWFLYVLTLIFGILSGFSKVQAVALPLAMLALDYWFERQLSWRLIIEKAPFWAASLGFGLLNIWGLGESKSLDDSLLDFTFLDRLAVGAWAFTTYLYKLVVPFPMSPLYPYPKEMPWYSYVSILLFFSAAAFWIKLFLSGKSRIWTFGIFFFTANVAFVLQIFGAGQAYLADRFTYVSYFGFFAVAAYFFDKYVEKQAVLAYLSAILVVGASAFWTSDQLKIWKNGESLWSHVIRFEGKTSPTAWGNRAMIYREAGNYEKAVEGYNTVIEITQKRPKSGDFNSRGKCFFDMAMSGKYTSQSTELFAKAMADYNRGVELVKETDDKKGLAELFINRGAAFGAQNRLAEAVADCTRGLTYDSTNMNGYQNRSLGFFALKRFEDAIKDYTKVLESTPAEPDFSYERGLAKAQLGRFAEAVEDYSTAIKWKANAKPQSVGLFYLERARALAEVGRKSEAGRDAAEAEKLGQPADADLKRRMSK